MEPKASAARSEPQSLSRTQVPTDGSPRPTTLRTYLPYEEVVELAFLTAARIGEKSNVKEFHLHVHIEDNSMVGDTYRQKIAADQIGAISLGEKSSATSYGSLTQNLEASQCKELEALLAKFAALVQKLKTPPQSAEKKAEAEQALSTVVSNVNEPDAGGHIRAAWKKASGWVSAMITAGVVVAKQAESAKALMKRIGELITSS